MKNKPNNQEGECGYLHKGWEEKVLRKCLERELSRESLVVVEFVKAELMANAAKIKRISSDKLGHPTRRKIIQLLEMNGGKFTYNYKRIGREIGVEHPQNIKHHILQLMGFGVLGADDDYIFISNHEKPR